MKPGKPSKLVVLDAIVQTLQSDLHGNGAAYIYGSDLEELSKAEVARRVNAAKWLLFRLARLRGEART